MLSDSDFAYSMQILPVVSCTQMLLWREGWADVSLRNELKAFNGHQ